MTDQNIRAAIKEVVDGYCDNTDLMVDDLVGVVKDAINDKDAEIASLSKGLNACCKEISDLKAENERMKAIEQAAGILRAQANRGPVAVDWDYLDKTLAALKEKP